MHGPRYGDVITGGVGGTSDALDGGVLGGVFGVETCTIMGYSVFWVVWVVGTVFSLVIGVFIALVHCTAGIFGGLGMERGSKVYQGFPFVGKKCGRGPLPG